MAELDPQNPDLGGNPNDPEGGQNPETEPVLTVEELQAKLFELEEKSNKEKEGLVGQIKELRGKLHEAQFVKEPKLGDSTKGGDEIEDKVRAVFSKDKEEKKSENKIAALREFYQKHSEFNPDNDIAGLRNEVLMSSYKKLNIQNSISKEEILDDLESALVLMNKSLSKEEGKSELNQYASTPTFGGKPKAGEEQRLTPEQEKLRKEKGWTVEKYLKMKARYPKIVL